MWRESGYVCFLLSILKRSAIVISLLSIYSCASANNEGSEVEQELTKSGIFTPIPSSLSGCVNGLKPNEQVSLLLLRISFEIRNGPVSITHTFYFLLFVQVSSLTISKWIVIVVSIFFLIFSVWKHLFAVTQTVVISSVIINKTVIWLVPRACKKKRLCTERPPEGAI